MNFPSLLPSAIEPIWCPSLDAEGEMTLLEMEALDQMKVQEIQQITAPRPIGLSNFIDEDEDEMMEDDDDDELDDDDEEEDEDEDFDEDLEEEEEEDSILSSGSSRLSQLGESGDSW